jgi:hypothetical protein
VGSRYFKWGEVTVLLLCHREISNKEKNWKHWEVERRIAGVISLKKPEETGSSA